MLEPPSRGPDHPLWRATKDSWASYSECSRRISSSSATSDTYLKPYTDGQCVLIDADGMLRPTTRSGGPS